jgi:hypothetical protein
LPLAERIRLRQDKNLRLHEHSLPRRSARRSEDDEFADPADLAITESRVVEELEPVLESDLAQISDAFSAALIWASQARSLVEMGWRIAAMLHVFRPALLEGMALEARFEHERSLRKAVSGSRSFLSKVGDYFRLVFAWLRRCDSLSQMGQRGFAMIYVMRRDLVAGKNGKNTNEALGALNNKTRQAFNKTVGDYRDCHRGFRNGVMRGEETRIKCRQAQTNSKD